jgi:hypothetical protein
LTLAKESLDGGKFQSVWLGGVNGTNLTGWQWTDASTWGDYGNWATGQPDDSRSLEHCLTMVQLLMRPCLADHSKIHKKYF